MPEKVGDFNRSLQHTIQFFFRRVTKPHGAYHFQAHHQAGYVPALLATAHHLLFGVQSLVNRQQLFFTYFSRKKMNLMFKPNKKVSWRRAGWCIGCRWKHRDINYLIERLFILHRRFHKKITIIHPSNKNHQVATA